MKRQGGFTLLELVVTATVLMILASAVVPLARNGIKRQQELELRRTLREMRTAIDDYKKLAEQQKIKAPPTEANNYPESLQVLVEGVPATGSLSRKIRFL
ncbi:MAG TPA: type II secretion system protein, partial [Geothrix sp.]